MALMNSALLTALASTPSIRFTIGGGHYFVDRLKLYGEVVYYPTGMWSLSANYYELFFKLGLSKQW